MSSLLQIIRQEIRSQGPMPFHRFMELALYCPDLGYYEQKSRIIGQGGDFFTSPSSGPLFGQLLARRFAWWLEVFSERPLYLVEAGSHDGTLAQDILTWFHREEPALAARLVYGILEPSARRQQWQETRLAPWKNQVRWWKDWSDFGEKDWVGVIFSNELLDAWPVRRLGWAAQTRSWSEWGVDLDGDILTWVSMPLPVEEAFCLIRQAGIDLPLALQAVLPDGFTLDLCPEAADWWRTAARTLEQGWLMTLDYGFKAEQFMAPERADGTLRGYCQHRLIDDLLNIPGQQDLTAHVHFTQLQAAGESEGLTTTAFVSQARFLTDILNEAVEKNDPMQRWDAGTIRQFQTLTHPEHMGRSFKVLLQERSVGAPQSSSS